MGKLRQIDGQSPNSPMFSPTNVLRYRVYQESINYKCIQFPNYKCKCKYSYQKLYLRNCTNTNVVEPKSEIYHLTFILPVMPEVIRTDRMHDNTWNVRLRLRGCRYIYVFICMLWQQHVVNCH